MAPLLRESFALRCGDARLIMFSLTFAHLLFICWPFAVPAHEQKYFRETPCMQSLQRMLTVHEANPGSGRSAQRPLSPYSLPLCGSEPQKALGRITGQS